jgi:hypothetical protein
MAAFDQINIPRRTVIGRVGRTIAGRYVRAKRENAAPEVRLHTRFEADSGLDLSAATMRKQLAEQF